MERAIVAVLSVIVVSMGVMGCVKPDPDMDSPIGSIPKIIVDHVEDETKVDVKGLDDHRYSSISIRVFRGNDTYLNLSEENVFTQHAVFSQKEFTLNITVADKKKVYGLEGDFTVDPPTEPNVVLLIITYNEQGKANERRITENDLPWRTLADRVE